MSVGSEYLWGIIPAAGSGQRFAHDRAKQHHHLLDKNVFYYTISQLLNSLPFRKIVVVINEKDPYWSETLSLLPESFHQKLLFTQGGQERADSVFSGLSQLKPLVKNEDWVLVHDAARPCVHADCLQKLWRQVLHTKLGGILATPVRDTLKKEVNSESAFATNVQLVEKTVDRTYLWQAQTPQIFRFNDLFSALEKALINQFPVTDEASAIEQLDLPVQMIHGRADNIKITYPEDLRLAELILKAQQKGEM